jgi:acyl carrier protein
MSIDNSIKLVIIKHIDIALNIDKISSDQYLADIGVNSINFIRMIIEIEQEYDIQFDIDKLGIESFEQVGNFIAYVDKLVRIQVNN